CGVYEQDRHGQVPAVFRHERVGDVRLGVHVPTAGADEAGPSKCRGVGVLVGLGQDARVAFERRDPAAPRAYEAVPAGLPMSAGSPAVKIARTVARTSFAKSATVSAKRSRKASREVAAQVGRDCAKTERADTGSWRRQERDRSGQPCRKTIGTPRAPAAR